MGALRCGFRLTSRLIVVATASLGAVLLVGGHSAGQQLGTLTVTPSSGPVGTEVVLEGQGCADSGSPPAIVFEGVAGQGTGRGRRHGYRRRRRRTVSRDIRHPG